MTLDCGEQSHCQMTEANPELALAQVNVASDLTADFDHYLRSLVVLIVPSPHQTRQHWPCVGEH